MTTATGFKAIVGQQHPITLLKTLIRNGTLPHALLFTGDDGVGNTIDGHGLGHGLQLPDAEIGGSTTISILKPSMPAVSVRPAKKLPQATIRTLSISPPSRR